MVKTLTEDFTGTNVTPYHNVSIFFYDDLNRISDITSDSANIDLEYSNGLIIKNIRYKNFSPRHIYYYFNKASLLDSSVSITESFTDTLHIIYTYNSNNQVTQSVERTISNTGNITELIYKYEYDEKGNPSIVTGYFDINNFDSETTYTYSDSTNFTNSADMLYPDRIKSADLLKTSNFRSHVQGSFHHKPLTVIRLTAVTE
jgi:hypothetical protein